MDSTFASHLEFVIVAYGQEPTNCQSFDAVCAARVNALLKNLDFLYNNNFMRSVALQSW